MSGHEEDTQGSKPAKKDKFIEFYSAYKESHEDLKVQQSSDVSQTFKRLENEFEKCVGLIKEGRHSCNDILNQILMKNFCTLKSEFFAEVNGKLTK